MARDGSIANAMDTSIVLLASVAVVAPNTPAVASVPVVTMMPPLALAVLLLSSSCSVTLPKFELASAENCAVLLFRLCAVAITIRQLSAVVDPPVAEKLVDAVFL